MEFNVGDLIIAKRLPKRIHAFENGDIVQITEKLSDNRYNVKVIHKSDNKSYNGVINWGVTKEIEYFDKL